MSSLPSLFLSHGAPTLAIERSPAHEYLKWLGKTLATPKAIVIVSAHHVARGVAVTSDAHPETIYDFRGFPDALYRMSYPAPGAPDLAAKIIAQLNRAGIKAAAQPHRGLDHGAWVPLRLMFPKADIPVVQVSIDMSKSPAWHFELGSALSSFRSHGVLIVGSGGATHNLHAFFKGDFYLDAPSPNWVASFADWIAEHIAQGDFETVLKAIDIGPNGSRNHPTMDHILPLFVAMGAGGAKANGDRVHKSSTYGVLAMDVYGFGAPEEFGPLADPRSAPLLAPGAAQGQVE